MMDSLTVLAIEFCYYADVPHVDEAVTVQVSVRIPSRMPRVACKGHCYSANVFHVDQAVAVYVAQDSDFYGSVG
jgi:hypothetical protein